MTAVTERQSQSARADREAMRSIAPARDTLGNLAVAMKAVAERQASSAVARSESSGDEDPLIIVPSFTRPRPKEGHQTPTASETKKPNSASGGSSDCANAATAPSSVNPGRTGQRGTKVRRKPRRTPQDSDDGGGAAQVFRAPSARGMGHHTLARS